VRHRPFGLLAVLAVLGAAGGIFTAVRSSTSSSSPAKAAVPMRRPSTTGFRLLSTTPTAGATGVDAGGPFTMSFSQPLAANSPLPSFSPITFGTWSRPSPSTLVLTPVADLALGTTVTMTIPGGPDGVRTVNKLHLPSTQTMTFTIDTGSTLRLQQLLAQLNYLPVSFTPTTPPVTASGPVSSLAQPGQFQWRWLDVPPQLQSLWQQGQNNVISTGALMQFEGAHGFTTSTDPTPTPQIWSALFQAASTNQVAATPYTWVMVSQALPETLTVWQNGANVFSSPTNSGISAAPTATGTYPVYERFTVTTMSGRNPDGSVYHDPGIPDVSYFNGGDAIHGFARPGYGYPQSLGCVELPFAAAAAVFPLTPIGTLVTVL
jgi:hypothetical protein